MCCRIFVLLFLMSLNATYHVNGQFTNFDTESAIWYDGEIQLANGEEKYGKLNYNFISNIVLLKSDKLGTYNPEEVALFKVKDSTGAMKATYYSLPYDVYNTERQGAVFFEVVFEKGTTAVLSRHDLEVKNRNILLDPWQTVPANTSQTNTGMPIYKKIEKVHHTLYIADMGSGIKPFMEGVKKSYNWTSFIFPDYTDYTTSYREAYKYQSDDKLDQSITEKERKRYKILDKRTLSTFTNSHYDNVKNYISSNGIKTNTIEGLIEVMDYYEQLKSSTD